MLKQISSRFTRLIFALLAVVLVLLLTAIFVLQVVSFRSQSENSLRVALNSTRYSSLTSAGEAGSSKDAPPLPMGVVIALYEADGAPRSLAAPPDLSEESVSSALASARQAEEKSGSIYVEGRRFLYGRRTFSSGALKVVLVDLTQQEISIRNALLILLGTGAAGLTLLWFVSRFVAKRAVLPVEEAFSKQENFVADASHELKTPLAIVTATLSAVEADPAATVAQQKHWFDEIRRQCSRMAALINDMLTLAKLDAAPQPLALVSLDFSDLTEGTALSFEAVLFEHAIALTADVAPGVRVRGNEASLSQLLTILLDNACKHTPPGGSLSLSLRRTHSSAVLTVQNTGDGIPAEHLSHIFDRFYRVDSGRSRSEGGYGLGLSIAHSIVKAHRGNISAASVPGSSTTFTVELPLCDPA